VNINHWGRAPLIVRLGPAGLYVGAGIVIVAGIAFITFATLALVRGLREGSLKVSAFNEMGSASRVRLAASLVLGLLLCNGLLFLLSRPVSLSAIITVNIVIPLAWPLCPLLLDQGCWAG
jgi:hypothetical protein